MSEQTSRRVAITPERLRGAMRLGPMVGDPNASVIADIQSENGIRPKSAGNDFATLLSQGFAPSPL